MPRSGWSAPGTSGRRTSRTSPRGRTSRPGIRAARWRWGSSIPPRTWWSAWTRRGSSSPTCRRSTFRMSGCPPRSSQRCTCSSRANSSPRRTWSTWDTALGFPPSTTSLPGKLCTRHWPPRRTPCRTCTRRRRTTGRVRGREWCRRWGWCSLRGSRSSRGTQCSRWGQSRRTRRCTRSR